jgi:hypothetical protein
MTSRLTLVPYYAVQEYAYTHLSCEDRNLLELVDVEKHSWGFIDYF